MVVYTDKVITLKSINPSTLEVLAEVQVTSQAAINEAFQASRQALLSWRETTLQQRLKKIESFYQLLIEQSDEIARLITAEVGKPLLESYLGEISGPLDMCLWLKKEAAGILSSKEIPVANPLMLGKKHWLKFEPLGVVGIISPWNYPFSIPVMTMLMALAAGNTVILKPSEKSPLIGLKIAELFRQAGFPEHVVTVVTGDGQSGQELAGQDLGRLIFTGSIATGIKVINSTAPNITPLTLELGGKDPAIVLPDAPIERTAHGIAWGAFTNAGQACASIERLYLVRGGNSQAILDRLVEIASKLKVGDPLLPTTQIGPLIDVQQFDHVVTQVEQAIALGAKVLCGASTPVFDQSDSASAGKKISGYFYLPTIITDVSPDMKIMAEETFGPVLPVTIVDSVEKAISLANQSKYALTASVWSSNIQHAQKIADKLEAGSVLINDCLYTHALPELPWGGLKKAVLAVVILNLVCLIWSISSK